MTKEQIVKGLEKEIKRNQRLADYFLKQLYDERCWQFYLGKAQGFTTSKRIVEAMHDDEYWNEAVADAIAMGDRHA